MFIALSPLRHCWQRIGAMALLVALLAARPVQAADCNVSSSGVAFGRYDPFAVAPLDGAGDIEIQCDSAVDYSIALSAGAGSYAQRHMGGPGDTLAYNLYVAASRLLVWGDGGAGTSMVSGQATSAHHAVYGRIPARQNVRPGSYQDPLVITLSF